MLPAAPAPPLPNYVEVVAFDAAFSTAIHIRAVGYTIESCEWVQRPLLTCEGEVDTSDAHRFYRQRLVVHVRAKHGRWPVARRMPLGPRHEIGRDAIIGMPVAKRRALHI